MGLEEGASVTLHTDGSCSGTGIGSGTVATGESSVTITPTTSLTAKYNRIYAKIGELCSKSGADYTFENGTELMTGEALSHDHTPTLTVASVASGDELSLHSVPDCSDAALDSATASGTSETLEPTLANHGRHTLYLKQNGICHPRGFDYSLVRHLGKPSPISGGDAQTCALTSSGGVKCWGQQGGAGKLGNNATGSDLDYPVDVEISDGTALSGIVQMDSGKSHTCAVTDAGGVMCWGNGSNGKLGNDASNNSDHAVAVVDANDSTTALTNILQVSAGEEHTCAVTYSGGVKCWGEGDNGRLGNKAYTDRDYPVNVVDANSNPLTDIVQFSVGRSHTCALTSSGGVKCWGSGTRLGQNSNLTRNYAVDVVTSSTDATPLAGIVQISTGDQHSCGLTTSSGVKCWGGGGSGQLGDGDSNNHLVPVDVVTGGIGNRSPFLDIVEVSTRYKHNCAVTIGGGVKCWGSGSSGQLGNSGTDNINNIPVNVHTASGNTAALTGIARVGMGYEHSCAVTSTGTLKCWGKAANGRLGNDCDSTCTDQTAPVDVIDANGSSTALNIGTTHKRYACTEIRCGWLD